MKLSLSNLSTLYSWFHNRFMACLNRKSDLWNFESRKLKEKENKFFFSFFFFFVKKFLRLRTLNAHFKFPRRSTISFKRVKATVYASNLTLMNIWWMFRFIRFDRTLDYFEFIRLQKLKQWANHDDESIIVKKFFFTNITRCYVSNSFFFFF